MLFLGNAARNEDAKVTNARMNRVYDGLAIGANFVDVLVKVENPSQRLRRRRDVVALRADPDDGRAEIAATDGVGERCLDSSCGEPLSRALPGSAGDQRLWRHYFDQFMAGSM